MRRPNTAVSRVSSAPVEKFTSALRGGAHVVQFSGWASTKTLDLYGDIVEPSGWDLRNYKANPVLLYLHTQSIPIGGVRQIRAVPDTGLRIDLGEVVLTKYVEEELLPLMESGDLRGISVGFVPLEFEDLPLPKDADPTKCYPGKRYTKQLLLENSLCPIPANPPSLIDMTATLQERAFAPTLPAGVLTPAQARYYLAPVQRSYAIRNVPWTTRTMEDGLLVLEGGAPSPIDLPDVDRAADTGNAADLALAAVAALAEALEAVEGADTSGEEDGEECAAPKGCKSCLNCPGGADCTCAEECKACGTGKCNCQSDKASKAAEGGLTLSFEQAYAAAYRAKHDAEAVNWTCHAATDLPLDKDTAWDGATAMAAVFTWAGWPDTPDPEKARQCFLAYDAGNGSLKGAYKLPFATVVNGKPVALWSGLKAAASRLPQAGIPESVREHARSVIDGYRQRLQGDKTATNVREPGVFSMLSVLENLRDVGEVWASDPETYRNAHVVLPRASEGEAKSKYRVPVCGLTADGALAVDKTLVKRETARLLARKTDLTDPEAQAALRVLYALYTRAGLAVPTVGEKSPAPHDVDGLDRVTFSQDELTLLSMWRVGCDLRALESGLAHLAKTDWQVPATLAEAASNVAVLLIAGLPEDERHATLQRAFTAAGYNPTGEGEPTQDPPGPAEFAALGDVRAKAQALGYDPDNLTEEQFGEIMDALEAAAPGAE